MLIQIEFQGYKYKFIKDYNNVGYWIQSSGPRSNMMVSKIIAHQLQLEAKNQGYNPEIFQPVKKPEKKAISVEAKSTKSKTAISLSTLLRKGESV